METNTSSNLGTSTTVPNTTPPVNPTNRYTTTNNPVANYGEKSSSTLALQNAINAVSPNKIATDSMYGDQTKGAYDSLIKQGYTYSNGAFIKPSISNTNTSPGAVNGSTGASTSTTTPSTAPSTPTKTPEETEADTISKETLTEAQKVHDQILGIQNGSIPLDAGEQAQIDGLKQQFQQMIDQQNLINTGASGLANVRGFQTGSAEYDANFATKTIGSIITAGVNKINDLNVKMASAVATLTQALKDNKIAGIKSAYDVLTKAKEDRQAYLQKVIENTQKVIKEQQDRQQKTTDDINQIAQDAAKNGADAKTINLITNSGSVSNAIANAGDFLQTGTGTLGDYLQYKRETVAKGLTPMDYIQFKDNEEKKASQRKASEAYSSAYNSAMGKAAAESKIGGTSNYTENQLKKINNINQDVSKNATYSKTTSMRNYGDNVNASLSLGTGVGDISAINQFQKVIDEGAVTRDQDVVLIQSSQSLADKLKTKIKKLEKGEQLSPELRKEMKQAVDSLYQAQVKALLKDPYISSKKKEAELNKIRIEDTILGELGTFSSGTNAATNVDDYINNNPQKGERVAKLYELPGWDDDKVWEYIQQIQ